MSAPDSQVLCLSASLSFRLARHFNCTACIAIPVCGATREILSGVCGTDFLYRGFRKIAYVSGRSRSYLRSDSMKSGDVIKCRVTTDGFQIEREREIRAIWRPTRDIAVPSHRDIHVPDLCKCVRFHVFK